MQRPRVLVAIGSNPPAQTSGARTLARVELARRHLDFEEVALGNLFAYPSYRSGELTTLGQTSEGWTAARDELSRLLDHADGILLAFGIAEPSGPARAHFRAQVEWLESEIERRKLASWWVGGGPRHPSRWQRYTWRNHPGLPFYEAFALSLQRR